MSTLFFFVDDPAVGQWAEPDDFDAETESACHGPECFTARAWDELRSEGEADCTWTGHVWDLVLGLGE
jgi:hypothetical protein